MKKTVLTSHSTAAVLALLALATVVAGCREKNSTPKNTDGGPPQKKWAEPMKLDGVPNFFKVAPALYRSAQPTEEGMANLKKMGIKTIINLRSFHSDRDEIGESGLAYEHIYMKAWHPEEKEVVRFLQIMTDKARTPALVHCMHGSDRTGTMCVMYRVAVEGWTKEEAVREMTEGNFGFHEVWENLPDFIRDIDIAEMKRRAGIATQ